MTLFDVCDQFRPLWLPSQALPSQCARRRVVGRHDGAEVAQLAGVSVDWYTWLEQGRPITVSTHLLESLVQALHLNANEREHLFFLAHNNLLQRGQWSLRP